MLLSALLVFSQSNPPDLSQKVSIDVRGGSGVDLCKELTRISGIAFEAVEAARSERFVVHAEDRPLSEVMKRIAMADHGDFLHFGAGYELRRSPGKVEALANAQREKMVARFQETLNGYRRQLAATPDFDDETAGKIIETLQIEPPPNQHMSTDPYWQKRTAAESATPMNRAIQRLVLTFSAEQLADLPFDRPTVFCTRPTKMQFELPAKTSAMLKNLASEEDIWETALKNSSAPKPSQADFLSARKSLHSVSNALLSLERFGRDGPIEARLRLLDEKDAILSNNTIFVSPAPGPHRTSPVLGQKPYLQMSETDISIALSEFLTTSSYNPKNLPFTLTDTARSILVDPVKIDPLGSFVADALLDLSRAQHEDLAAVVDDDLVAEVAVFTTKQGLDQALLEDLRNLPSHQVSEGSGWLVLSENRPDTADEDRCDRTALKKLIDSAQTRGCVSLDEAATYSLSTSHADRSWVTRAYLSALVGKSANDVLSRNDNNLLRFYGSLDTNQRKSVDHLPFLSLSRSQVGLLEEIVFGNKAELALQPSDAQRAAGKSIFEQLNTPVLDPTYSLGNGLPSDGYLEIKLDKSNILLSRVGTGMAESTEGASDGWTLAPMVSRIKSEAIGTRKKPLRLRAAEQTYIRFQFKFSDQLSQNLSLAGVTPISNEVANYDDLPEAFRKSIQSQIDAVGKRSPRLDPLPITGATKTASPR